MIGLIIGLISAMLYGIAVIVIVGGFLLLPLLIKGGWILYLILIIWLVCFAIIYCKGENDNDNKN